VGEGGVVNISVVTEAGGHALNVECELVGEGVGSRCTANVTANVATNKTAAESETEELLRVREPVSEGGAKHGRFFGSDVSHPVAKGDVGVLIGVTAVGRAFEDGEG
jgi:hypothetical protein